MAVSDAMLQGDAPLPPRRACGRTGIGRKRRDRRARNRKGPIARQPVRPVLEAGFQSVLDQQAAKTGTVDEKISRQPPIAFEKNAVYIAGFPLQGHLDDLSLDAPHAARFPIASQHLGVETGVKMKGVGHVRQSGGGARLAALHLAGQSRLLVQGIEAKMTRRAPRSEPMVLKGRKTDVAPDGAKGVHVTMAGLQPIDELNAQLEGALGRPDKGVLVQAEGGIEQMNLGNGGFTDPDRSDLFGFDQSDLVAMGQKPRQRRGCHPTSGPAADNQNFDRIGHRGRNFEFMG